MEQAGLKAVSAGAVAKDHFLRVCPARYAVYAMLAGCFCSIGMAFAYSAGGCFYATPAVAGLAQLAIGVSFALSFTLIVFAGSELFTGNVMVMTVGALDREIRPAQAIWLLVYCYFCNLLGAALMGWVVASTGLLSGTAAGELLVASSAAKMALPFDQAVFRGILCNIMVCLGTWMVYKIRSEPAKMIALLWVVTGFVIPGYEHSIANAGLFTMSALVAGAQEGITAMGMMRNMVPVTIGNIIGGAIFVGLGYWFAGRSPSEK